MAVALERVPVFYHKYIQQVTESHLKEAFDNHLTDFSSFLENLPEEKWTHRYAEGKWSIKEVVQHVIDTERIFNYRALAIARGETQSLPGFDENNYAAHSHADTRSKASLIAELKVVQLSTKMLFDSFDEEQLQAAGTSNNKPLYVEAIGYILIGHIRHHKNILQERYL